tara:strand:- start:961 stop:1281 length:321 start_codon:yes stop_codon:yes gene_type:complete
MEDQVPSSFITESKAPEAPAMPPGITAEQLGEMKRIALERAIQQHQQNQQNQQVAPQQPEVVYVRRNFTVAELLLVLVISCGLVAGVQMTWNFAANILPRVEIRLK